MLYCTVLYCTVLYCTVLYYTILYYTIPYHTMTYYNIITRIAPRARTLASHAAARLFYAPAHKHISLYLSSGVRQISICKGEVGAGVRVTMIVAAVAMEQDIAAIST